MRKLSATKKVVKSKKRGPKPIRINSKKVEELLKIGLSVRDIAKIVGVDEKTIRNKFSAEIEKRGNEEKIEFEKKKRG